MCGADGGEREDELIHWPRSPFLKEVAGGRTARVAGSHEPVRAGRLPDPEAYSAVAASFLQDLPGFVLRGPIYASFLIILCGLVYSCVGRVQTKVTSGLLVRGDEYVVESPVPGEVSALHVGPGESVGARRPLVTIFSPLVAADEFELGQLRADSAETVRALRELVAVHERIVRRTRELAGSDAALAVETFAAELKLPAGVVEDERAAADSVARTAAPERYAFHGPLVARYEIRQAGLRRDYVRARERLRRAREAFEQTSELYGRRVVPQAEYDAAQHAATVAASEVESLANEFRQGFHAVVAEVNAERDRLVERLRGVTSSVERIRVTFGNVEVDRQHVHLFSRYPGTVTRVAVRPLQPVATGSELLHILREDLPPYGVIVVPNSAIGEVEVGQRVYVKFAAYPFQQYGVQTGRIVAISPDLEVVEGLGMGYRAEVAFDALRPGISLKFGMQGMAEVATGERRIIELVMPPLSRILDGGED